MFSCKSKRRIAVFFAWFMLLAGAFSLFVFISSMTRDWDAGEQEWFEEIARIIGYALILTVYALSAAGAHRYRIHGTMGRTDKLAFNFALSALALLIVHDILLYYTYGNRLDGAFTMTAFFLIDGGLVLAYGMLQYLHKRYPQSPATAWLWVFTALLWLVYIVGDSAGYPISHLYDWDEALLKFGLLCHCMMQALLTPRGDDLSCGGNT